VKIEKPKEKIRRRRYEQERAEVKIRDERRNRRERDAMEMISKIDWRIRSIVTIEGRNEGN